MYRLIRKHVAGNASFWGLVEYGIGPVAALVALPILFPSWARWASASTR